ncbi:hypothetical protein CsSME_00041051 [Camellia sinensis var. sinensis]
MGLKFCLGCCSFSGDGILELKFQLQSLQLNMSFFGEADDKRLKVLQKVLLANFLYELICCISFVAKCWD